MLDFLDKYKAVFWMVGGAAAIGFALKMRNEMKRQELPPMRILPHKQCQKKYVSGNYLGSSEYRPPIRLPKPPIFDKSKPKIFYPSEYPFLVITPTNRIESGWDFRNDAVDHVRDLPKGSKVRIVARRTAKSLGIDPSNKAVWTRGETDLAGRRRNR